MAASFSYGRLDERFVHIADLDPAERRGLQCGCVCPKCGRQLQAHMGREKAWHFQHHVEDANCNPQPMTLLHEFVRDELARRDSLSIPKLSAHVEVEVAGERMRVGVTLPEVSFRYTSARTEAREGSVQPDVSFTSESGMKVALEVRYTHAVDPEKQAALRGSFQWAVEFDVSDLPSGGIGASELDGLLAEASRWKWLVNPHIAVAERVAAARYQWARSVFRAGPGIRSTPDIAHAPVKLRKAQQRLTWAKQALEDLRRWVVHAEDAADWLGERDRFERVAVACAALHIEPTALPGFLTQRLDKVAPQYVFRVSPHRWQPLVFMKFCIGRQAFSPQEAAKWCRRAMPELCASDDGTVSKNGFTWTAAALHVYFLHLEAQDLLKGASYVPEERTFTPRFGSVRQMHEYLAAKPAELGRAPATLDES